MALDYFAGSLVTICLHSLLYGIFMILYIASVYILLFRRPGGSKRARPINRALMASGTSLFCLITAHWVLCVSTAYDLFVRHTLIDVTTKFPPTYVATTAIILAEVIVADLTMMYRLYAVWGRNWYVVIPPLLTTCLSFALGANSLYNISTAHSQWAYYVKNRPIVLALCSTELSTNLLITALIGYRIWVIDRLSRARSPTSPPPSVLPLLNIIIESASIFTTLLVIILAAFAFNSVLDNWALQLSSPSIGIAFSLIIVRVGLGLGYEERGKHNISTNTSTINRPQLFETYETTPNSSTMLSRDSRLPEGFVINITRQQSPPPNMVP